MMYGNDAHCPSGGDRNLHAARASVAVVGAPGRRDGFGNAKRIEPVGRSKVCDMGAVMGTKDFKKV